jgi:pimeloyl-ACP methyl ester carboxylesterase
MHLHHVRLGTGKPLLLVHGLGASWQSWSTVVDRLAAEREVVAVDLPGFGETPPLVGKVSVTTTPVGHRHHRGPRSGRLKAEGGRRQEGVAQEGEGRSQRAVKGSVQTTRAGRAAATTR